MSLSCNQLLSADFCESLYSRLLDKEHWMSPDGSLHRLQNFLAAIAVRAEYLYGSNTGCVVPNDKKDKVLVNSGLVDRYGIDIWLIYSISQNGKFMLYQIVDSRRDLSRAGFARITNLEPLKFYDSKSDLIFDGTMEEMDLEDTTRLVHILSERIDRFPERVKDYPVAVLYSKLRGSIEAALRRCRVDYKYAVAMYNLRRHKIQFLLPFFLSDELNAAPELAIIIDKDKDYYSVKTIISLEEAYGNARVLSSQETWLNTKY